MIKSDGHGRESAVCICNALLDVSFLGQPGGGKSNSDVAEKGSWRGLT